MFLFPSLCLSSVIPAEAGIHDCKSAPVALDPGFRRGDGKEDEARKEVVSSIREKTSCR
jgi:hypothetical protein